MASSEVAITNLVYRYAEYIDTGDFEGAAALFAHARLYTGPELGEVEPARRRRGGRGAERRGLGARPWSGRRG